MGALVILGAITADRHGSSVALLRRYVGGVLADEGIEAEDAQLIASELGTNAAEHGAGEWMELLVSEHDDRIRLEMTDQGEGDPRVRIVPDDEESGRGLLIVAAIALEWGVRNGGKGTTVWADLPRKPS